jgi:hypothetical protein
MIWEKVRGEPLHRGSVKEPGDDQLIARHELDSFP